MPRPPVPNRARWQRLATCAGRQLLDEIDNVDLQVTNLAASSGGSEQEDNDRLRERIKLAPESFTNAGSRMAYRFHAMQAHPNIVDVAVLSPVPGTVRAVSAAQYRPAGRQHPHAG
jgi:phage-related baseplate assembly protein